VSDVTLAKLHATGNDFLVHLAIDPGTPELDADAVKLLCDRHRGIGADGLITITPGKAGADCAMTLRNADGGLAEMSGNGARCLAWVAARAGLARGDELIVDTEGGRRSVSFERDASGDVIAAEVDMGAITFEPTQIPVDTASPFDLEVTVDDTTYRGDAAGIGNPHLVLLVDDPAAVPVTVHGPQIEHDPRFPRRVNAEFITVAGPDCVAMRVWERGTGETLSCGTGACASAAVAHRRGLVGEQVRVEVLGGSLAVTLGPTVRLGGPVVHVFDVTLSAATLRDRVAQPIR
jgi:diaminopimelate epimerase